LTAWCQRSTVRITMQDVIISHREMIATSVYRLCREGLGA